MIEEVISLKEYLFALQCCGNCKHNIHNEKTKKTRCQISVDAWDEECIGNNMCCGDWKFDGLNSWSRDILKENSKTTRQKQHVEFDYYADECNLNNPDIGHWGCCCKCIHRKEVFKSCWHMRPEEEKSCICGQPFNFYICVIEDVMEKNGHVKICSEHGVCECFTDKETGNGIFME